jgi:hypothetical protein
MFISSFFFSFFCILIHVTIKYYLTCAYSSSFGFVTSEILTLPSFTHYKPHSLISLILTYISFLILTSFKMIWTSLFIQIMCSMIFPHTKFPRVGSNSLYFYLKIGLQRSFETISNTSKRTDLGSLLLHAISFIGPQHS